MTGQRFNRLLIINFSHIDKRHRRWYNTKCDCGLEKKIMGSAITSGNTKSCGCLSSDIKRAKRISNNHSEVTAIILGYKRHAEDRGISWGLTRGDVESVIFKDCFYCGQIPCNLKKTKNTLGEGLRYSGIDRVDSSRDYVLSNIVPCCKICNYAKSNMKIDEFKKWAISIGQKAMAEQWGKLLPK